MTYKKINYINSTLHFLELNSSFKLKIKILNWNLKCLLSLLTYLWQLFEFTGKLCNHWKLLVSVNWISLGNCQKFSEEFCIFIFLSFYVNQYSYNAECTLKDQALQSSRHYGHLFVAQQNSHTFSCNKKLLIQSPINTAKFCLPIGDHINGVPLYDWEVCSVYCIFVQYHNSKSSHCLFICTYRSHDWMWPQDGDLCVIALGPGSLLMWYSKLIVEGLRWSTQYESIGLIQK